MRSHEMMGKGYVFMKNSQMASIGAIFTSILHKAAKSLAKLISQLCGELQSAICLSRKDGAVLRPSEHLWMSDRLEKET